MNETFFKAQNAQLLHFIFLHVIKAPVKITHFPHFPIFSDPSLIISLAGTKAVSGPRFLTFLLKHLLSIFVKDKTLMNSYLRNTWNQILKLSNFTCFQILFTVLELSPLKMLMLCPLISKHMLCFFHGCGMSVKYKVF